MGFQKKTLMSVAVTGICLLAVIFVGGLAKSTYDTLKFKEYQTVVLNQLKEMYEPVSSLQKETVGFHTDDMFLGYLSAMNFDMKDTLTFLKHLDRLIEGITMEDEETSCNCRSECMKKAGGLDSEEKPVIFYHFNKWIVAVHGANGTTGDAKLVFTIQEETHKNPMESVFDVIIDNGNCILPKKDVSVNGLAKLIDSIVLAPNAEYFMMDIINNDDKRTEDLYYQWYRHNGAFKSKVI